MLTSSCGAGHDDDAVHRQGLEHVQGYVAGSGRHIHEHIVHVLPQHVAPELLHHAADDRAAPDDGVSLVAPAAGLRSSAGCRCSVMTGRMASSVAAARPWMPKALGMEGPVMSASSTRDVVAAALHGDGQLAGDHGLADAALAGHHAVDLADPAAFPQGLDLEGAARPGAPRSSRRSCCNRGYNRS